MNTTLLHTLPFSTRLTHALAKALCDDHSYHDQSIVAKADTFRRSVLKDKTVEDLLTYGLRNLAKVRGFGPLAAIELHKVLGDAGIENRADLIYSAELVWITAHENDAPAGQVPFEIAMLILAKAGKVCWEHGAMRFSYMRGVIYGLFYCGRINDDTKQRLLRHIEQR